MEPKGDPVRARHNCRLRSNQPGRGINGARQLVCLGCDEEKVLVVHRVIIRAMTGIDNSPAAVKVKVETLPLERLDSESLCTSQIASEVFQNRDSCVQVFFRVMKRY